MTIATFESEKLRLPRDVQKPREIIINGEITGSPNEIVVIMQLRRMIHKDAYVCHITEGEKGKGFYDLPGFKFLKVFEPAVKEFEGIKFTMCCTGEPSYHSNWLW